MLHFSSKTNGEHPGPGSHILAKLQGQELCHTEVSPITRFQADLVEGLVGLPARHSDSHFCLVVFFGSLSLRAENGAVAFRVLSLVYPSQGPTPALVNLAESKCEGTSASCGHRSVPHTPRPRTAVGHGRVCSLAELDQVGEGVLLQSCGPFLKFLFLARVCT